MLIKMVVDNNFNVKFSLEKNNIIGPMGLTYKWTWFHLELIEKIYRFGLI